jgi:methylphosphotriester-DNA--protein-cysteine methyltransferase
MMSRSTDDPAYRAYRIERAWVSFRVISGCVFCLSGCMLLMLCTGAVWRCQAEKYSYVANVEHSIFHKPSCKAARMIPEKGFVAYRTEAEAGADGKKPCWRCQPGKCHYVASARSEVFHRVSCPSVRNLTEKNLVAYATEAEARADGKTPASDCHP